MPSRKNTSYRSRKVETLEQRELLAADINFVDGSGLLEIIGTEQVDSIVIDYYDKYSIDDNGVATGGNHVVNDHDRVAVFERNAAGELYLLAEHDGVSLIQVDAGNGDDTIRNNTNISSTMLGGEGNDYLVGGDGDDHIEGGLGNDTLIGRRGDDTILGGDDDDVLAGGSQDDDLFGGAGNDTIFGGYGRDDIYGEAGNDALFTGYAAHHESSLQIFAEIAGELADDDQYEPDGNREIRELVDVAADEVVDNYLSHDHEDLEDADTAGGGIPFEGSLAIRTSLLGHNADDIVFGGEGHDYLESGVGTSVSYLDGGDGGDELVSSGYGYSYMHGGANAFEWERVAGFQWTDLADLEGEEIDVFRTRGSRGSRTFMLGGSGTDVMFGGAGTYSTLLGGDGDDILFASDIFGGRNEDMELSYVYGEAGDDWIYGTSGSDFLSGGSGNDYIWGGEKRNWIGGGAGDDTLVSGGSGTGYLYGHEGNDTLIGGSGTDWIYGGAGDDTLEGNEGDDVLRGEEGADEISTGEGFDSVPLDEFDTLNLGPGPVSVNGAYYDEEFDGQTLSITGSNYSFDIYEFRQDEAGDLIVSVMRPDLDNGEDTYCTVLERRFAGVQSIEVDLRAGNDRLTNNTNIPMRVFGGEGKDRIFGGSADDHIEGGAGQDRIYGGAGNDYIDGGDGDDTLYGEEGADEMYGRGGMDNMHGGDNPFTATASELASGNLEIVALMDVLDGGEGRDYLYGGAGSDLLAGGKGADWIWGDQDADMLFAETLFSRAVNEQRTDWGYANQLYGGGGDDYIFGSNGADLVNGESGNDFIETYEGNDRIFDGEGSDTVLAGSGNDEIWIDSGDNSVDGGDGHDFITSGDGVNQIEGGAGDDWIRSTENDTVSGGEGNDYLQGEGTRLDESELDDAVNELLSEGEIDPEAEWLAYQNATFGGPGAHLISLSTNLSGNTTVEVESGGNSSTPVVESGVDQATEMAALAEKLDARFDLTLMGKRYDNQLGFGEIWFVSARGEQYYLSRDGGLYQRCVSRDAKSDKLIAQFDEVYYKDPSKLFDAAGAKK